MRSIIWIAIIEMKFANDDPDIEIANLNRIKNSVFRSFNINFQYVNVTIISFNFWRTSPALRKVINSALLLVLFFALRKYQERPGVGIEKKPTPI